MKMLFTRFWFGMSVLRPLPCVCLVLAVLATLISVSIVAVNKIDTTTSIASWQDGTFELCTIKSCVAERNKDGTFTIDIFLADDVQEEEISPFYIIDRQVNNSLRWHWRGRATSSTWVDQGNTVSSLISKVIYRVRYPELDGDGSRPKGASTVECTTKDQSLSMNLYELPPTRRIDWSKTGFDIPNDLPVLVDVVTDHGATPNNHEDDDYYAFQAAIDAAHAMGGGIVSVPVGKYRISNSLLLHDNVVLQGAGAGKSELFFDGPLFQGILVGNTIPSEQGWEKLTSEAAKYDATLTVPNPLSFAVGSYAEIEMDNYPEDAPANNGWSQPPGPDETWRHRTPGQLLQVTSVSNSSISFTPSLHLTYELKQNPRIRPIRLVENAGIERLNIHMSDNNQGRAVKVQYASNFWMRDVETSNALASHVELFSTFGCQMEGNYLTGVSGNGDGGQGYGINVGRHTTGCRMENNILSGFRHAALFQVGATGNVFAYNYSQKSVHPEQNRADLSFHGHFANSNLIEGNVVQQIYVADWWGRVGPWNTFVRNCIRPVRPGDSGDLQISYDSDHQNVLGNVFSKSTSVLTVDSGVDGTIMLNNKVGGSRDLAAIIPQSFYLMERPHFFRAVTPWPVAQSEEATACINEASIRGVGVAN